MKELRFLDELVQRYPVLEPVKGDILKAYEIMRDCYEKGGKLMIAGNGGSCSDSEHIVGELMKGFVKRRPVSAELAQALKAADPQMGEKLAENLKGGLPAIALTGNDVNGDMVFAQQLYGYAKKGDVFLGITTSGNSKNVLYAATAAKALGVTVIGLTGRDGGRIKEFSDVSIIVPVQETFKIQELHLPVYHALCLMLEDHFYES